MLNPHRQLCKYGPHLAELVWRSFPVFNLNFCNGLIEVCPNRYILLHFQTVVPEDT